MTMKKTVVFVLILTVLLCGCNSNLEPRVAGLEEQLNLLQDRVSALEAENALLKQLLETSGEENVAPQVPELEPAAELALYDWTVVEDLLTLEGAFARVMSLGEGTAVDSCSLIFMKNGEALEASALTLLPGEAVDSFELEMGPLAYHLPELSDGDVLELRLEVLLTDGSLLTAWGGSWDYLDGALVMIAG
jgi:hypothetical protein